MPRRLDTVMSRASHRADAVGEAVGFCSCSWQVIDGVHINNLAVLPGIDGRASRRPSSIRALADGSAARGAHRDDARVRRSNEPALVYERCGFAVTAVRRGCTHTDEDALILWREGPLRSAIAGALERTVTPQ